MPVEVKPNGKIKRKIFRAGDIVVMNKQGLAFSGGVLSKMSPIGIKISQRLSQYEIEVVDLQTGKVLRDIGKGGYFEKELKEKVRNQKRLLFSQQTEEKKK